ncbi:branched-chain amino acid ABC transporter permease [Parathalassolituus penaei]|uniref:Branched-chain amino acid ABC transporter permease n=1 Tax=Parathalassolituus penaei TaxID=2997323 RepID=A0A9X3EGK0_9GAMM|nr:branched-chain amino acid ABC transporter permease [Parathalassolituus penaei]MCY0966334.1 branched-chain amino acid ABC transporter permease [Parathalassolituus penaei]
MTRNIVAAVVAVGLVILAASLPFWGEAYWMHEFVMVSCFFVFAMMWNLMAGYGGMVSVGQQAWFGLGGYFMLALANLGGVNPFVAIVLGAVLSTLIALPMSKLAFRLQGGYFAIGTWVMAEVVRLTVANISIVGGGSGTSLTAFRGVSRALRENVTYWVALVAVVATIVLVYLFLRSKQGLALQAIRDSEVAAESQGINVARMKLAVYLVSAFGCAIAGGLYFVSNLRISPDAAFSVNWTAFGIFIVMIGGIGRIEGPVIGTLVFWLVSHYFSDYGTWYLIGLGALAIMMTLYARQGITGLLDRFLGVDLFPTRRVFVARKVEAKPAPAARVYNETAGVA